MDVYTFAKSMGNALTTAEYAALLPAYLEAMRAAEINTVNRAAMFAAQLGHESVGLSALEEYASGAAYEGRVSSLGNTQPGDGVRFKGRGAIMITGRANYTALSKWAHGKGMCPTATYFVDSPKALQSTEYAFVGAVWYWTVARPDLNQLSDNGDLVQVTRRINGGTTNIEDRRFRWNQALQLGNALLPPGTTPPEPTKRNQLVSYSRDRVTQETPWNCGPASVETSIQAATGKWVSESVLAGELGTHRGGTDWIGQFPAVLNKHIPGAEYRAMEMPSDPPTAEQKEKLWADITASIDAGHPVILNIVSPPSNRPRSVAPSTIDLAYSGGTIYHYVAVMDYAGTGANRRVWWADSGFAPYGAWIGFDQIATLVPPKGYAYSTAKPLEEGFTMSEAQRVIDFISVFLGPAIQDNKDNRQQITGSRDSIPGDIAASYPGWDMGQLLKAARDKGFNGLTMLEMCAVACSGTDEDRKAATAAANPGGAE